MKARKTISIAVRGAAIGFALLALAAFPAAAQEGFGFGAADGAQASAAAGTTPTVSHIAISGDVDYSARLYPDTGDLASSSVDSLPSARIEFGASSTSISAFAALDLDPETLAKDPAKLLAEAWASADMGPLSVKGGLQRISWGVADSLRVLDVLSPHDYRSFTFSEVEDQYLPQASLSAKLSLGSKSSLQAVWTPFFEGDQYATSGKWEPKQMATMLATAKQGFYWGLHPTANGGLGDGLYSAYYSQAYAAAYAATGGDATAAALVVSGQIAAIQAEALEEAANRTASFIVYPDTDSLKYSQVGARFVTSLGGVDLGAQYWYGFDRRPSYDMATAMTSGEAEVSYDRLQHIGADAAFALAGFNVRLEGAANLTEDADGTNRLVHNRSLAWAAGVDKEILGTTVNLQGMQTYVLDAEGITSQYDVEYGAKNFDTKVALTLDRSFDRDKAKAQLAGVWEIEQEDYMLSPSIAFTVSDDAVLRLAGRVFLGDEDGNFGQYEGNSYAEVSIKYSF